MTVRLTASRECRSTDATPGYPPLRIMLDELEAKLAARGLKPFAVSVSSWRTAADRILARIEIEAAPGAPGAFAQSLRSWFQWQHPTWNWSSEPMPMVAT
jgi:hypothetical protein